jgi:hypothetical protein
MKGNRLQDDETERIKGKIVGFGADLVGVADAEPLKTTRLKPPDLLAPFSRAVFEEILDRPTPNYTVCQTANRILDEIAFRTVDGFSELPHVGVPVCGICIKACPFGQKTSKKGKKQNN